MFYRNHQKAAINWPPFFWKADRGHIELFPLFKVLLSNIEFVFMFHNFSLSGFLIILSLHYLSVVLTCRMAALIRQ